MNILYISHNVHLRSTTCVIDAAIESMYPKFIQPFMVFPRNGPWVEQLRKMGINCYEYPFVIPDKNQPYKFLKNLMYWVRFIYNHNIDIIHLNEHDNYPMIRHAVKITKTKVIVGVRYVIDGGYGNWAFSGKYKPSKLLFTSQDQLTRCQPEIPSDYPSRDIVLFGNGRNLKGFLKTPDQSQDMFEKYKLRNDEYILGTASVIRSRKRIEDFIEVVHRLMLKGLNVRGFVAGGGCFSDPAYFESLKSQIRQLKAESYIHMLGNVENIADFYRKIDIFVSTSELETFGMSVCEAMAFARPVVTYEGGSVKEVLNDYENTVVNGDKDKMIERIALLIKDPGYYQSCAEKNQIRAFSYFDTDILADKLKNIYQQVYKKND